MKAGPPVCSSDALMPSSLSGSNCLPGHFLESGNGLVDITALVPVDDARRHADSVKQNLDGGDLGLRALPLRQFDSRCRIGMNRYLLLLRNIGQPIAWHSRFNIIRIGGLQIRFAIGRRQGLTIDAAIVALGRQCRLLFVWVVRTRYGSCGIAPVSYGSCGASGK